MQEARMRPRYPKLQRACILATLLFTAVWALSGFWILDLNHVRIGQGSLGIFWGTRLGYHIESNSGPFCRSLLLPRYRSFAFVPTIVTLPPGLVNNPAGYAGGSVSSVPLSPIIHRL